MQPHTTRGNLHTQVSPLNAYVIDGLRIQYEMEDEF